MSTRPETTTSLTLGPPRRELYLVAFDVPDRDELVRDLLARPQVGVEVVELHGGGVAEITAVLRSRSGLDAIHLLSHGSPGALVVGPDVLDARTLPVYSADLRAWGAALNPGGDLLLYGCDLAAGPGREFVTQLSSLAGADVAASTDPTGTPALGGDWDLEYATGRIESKAFAGPVGWTHTLGSVLLFATKGNVSGAATTGLTAWSNGQVLQMGGANFAVEPGTSSGTVSSAFDLRQFGGGSVGVDALHYVLHQLTVGTGSATMTLLPGDVLVSANNSAILTGSTGPLSVADDEVFVFRPTTAGNYAAGSFTMLLDNFASITGGSKPWAVTVAETDVVVGDYMVPQGTFLYTLDGGPQDDQIALFTPTGVGAGRTAGTTAVLIDGGKDLGMGPPIRGLDLVEVPTTVAGRFLPAGTLILALDNSATVGSNRLAVTAYDVFALAVTNTTLVAGTAAATASLLFQGVDAGLGGSNAKFAAVSLGGSVGNNPPAAGGDGYTTAEDTPLTVTAVAGLLSNDSDPDGDPLTVTGYTQPTHGVVAANADGSLSYTPAADYNGPDSFTYTVSDGRGGTAVGAVTLAVTAANDPPVSRDDFYSTAVDLIILSTPLSVAAPGVLGNDSDVDGDTLTAQLLSGPANGLFSFNADGSFTYTALLSFSGTDSFAYRVWDGTAWSTAATVFINVSSSNQAPTATADGYTTAEDSPLVVSPTGVLGNDSDPDGDPLTASLVAGPAHGSLTLSPDGTFTYVPDADWNGIDSFAYQAVDPQGATSPAATVTLTVAPVNDPPAAVDDSGTTAEDAPVTIAVRGNDADVDGDTLTVTAVGTAGHGTVTADGSTVSYTPAPDWNGADTFTYTASDANGGFTTASVTVIVTAVNDPPVAAVDGYTTTRNTPIVVPPSGVLANDADVDCDALSAVLVVGPANGALTLNADGSFTYTPDPGFFGTDSFGYMASDGLLSSGVTTVTLRVLPPAGRPVAAADDSYTVAADAVLTVSPAGVLVNDTGTGNGSLSAVLVSGPAHGTLTLHPDGSFTYTPDPGFAGTDSFNYKATDGGGTSATAHVTITVASSDRPPVGMGDAFTTDAGVPLATAAPGVLANDTDPDGNALTAELLTGGAHGTVTMADDGSFTYTPDPGFAGTDSFTYRVTAGQQSSGVVTVKITVSAVPIPDPPAAPLPVPPVVHVPTPPADPLPVPAGPGLPELPSVPSAGEPVAPIDGLTPVLPPLTGETGASNTTGPIVNDPVGVITGGSTGGVTITGPTITGQPFAPILTVSEAGRVYAAPAAAVGNVAAAGPAAPAANAGQPQPVAAPPSSLPPTGPVLAPSPPAPVTAIAPPVTLSAVGLVPPESLLAPLDQVRDELRAEVEARAATDVVVLSSGVAVAGYVLLNTRAVYWFLSALLARRAVWRGFDPLDVVYAWERENGGSSRGAEPGADESLQSIVG